MTVDIETGVYLCSDGPRSLFGACRPDEVEGYNLSRDWPWLESVIEMAMGRFPWLSCPEARLRRGSEV
jgi:sarcosine oxidase subunit beta